MTEHKSAGAFKLMQYQCEKCKRTEVIWNSRDGVTPFCVGCKDEKCDGLAQHERWDQDMFAPDHKPYPGARIFINLTMEKSAVNRKKYVEKHWRGYPAMSEHYESQEDAIEKLAKHDYESFGAGTTPDLIEVK